MVNIQINVDEKSGKITAFTIQGEDLKPEVMERAIDSIRQSFTGNAPAQAQAASVMAKDIRDLSADRLTIKDRLTLFLKFEYGDAWFSTLDVKAKYEKTYNEELKISTVSTYLSRLHNEGFLARRGNKIEREYHIAATPESEPVATNAPAPARDQN